MLRTVYPHTAPSGRQAQCAPSVTVRTRCRSSSATLSVLSASVSAQPVPARPAVAHTALPAPNAARFEDDCTLFVEEFRIRGNEAGPDQRANIITIANLLQVGVKLGRHTRHGLAGSMVLFLLTLPSH
eukprot:GHUV01012788.1.p1 GENE.GHUV01012788.1~~GHUV01012788.1.p1  ORF type:complete len:128 (+),score=15.71 GHUV01012788.1:217-600(+)